MQDTAQFVRYPAWAMAKCMRITLIPRIGQTMNQFRQPRTTPEELSGPRSIAVFSPEGRPDPDYT